jgi:hypothetical protein
MKQILAIGSRPFVRQAALGGAVAHVAPTGPEGVEVIRGALARSDVGLIVIEAGILDPSDELLRKRRDGDPIVVTVGKGQAEHLRREARRVLGADVLAVEESKST